MLMPNTTMTFSNVHQIVNFVTKLSLFSEISHYNMLTFEPVMKNASHQVRTLLCFVQWFLRKPMYTSSNVSLVTETQCTQKQFICDGPVLFFGHPGRASDSVSNTIILEITNLIRHRFIASRSLLMERRITVHNMRRVYQNTWKSLSPLNISLGYVLVSLANVRQDGYFFF